MYKLYLLSCLFVRKGIIRFIAPLLLSTLVLVGIVRPNRAYGNVSDLVGLTVHNDKSGQINYILITKGNNDPNVSAFCQPVPSLDWVDVQSSPNIPAKATPGQIIWLGYFSSPKCDPSSLFMTVLLPIPASPIFNHCWFNPDNTITPNWSGCVSPSRILPINWAPTGDSYALESQMLGRDKVVNSGDSNLQGQQSCNMSQAAQKVLEEASQLRDGVLALTQLFVQMLPLAYTIDRYPLLT